MSSVIYNNPSLLLKLQSAVNSGSVVKFCETIRTLRNSELKAAGFILRTSILPRCDDDFFKQSFLNIVPQYSKAYLMTFVKAAIDRYQQSKLSLIDPFWETYQNTNPSAIDCQKLLMALLPIANSPEEIEFLINLFVPNCSIKLNYLMHVATRPAAFVLFKLAKQEEGNHDELKRICIFLLKRGDKLAFGQVAIMKYYFGLSDIPGYFSLNLQPYQLSRLDDSYAHFCEIING